MALAIWRCFAIGIGKTRDVEVGVASSTSELGESRAGCRIGAQWFRVLQNRGAVYRAVSLTWLAIFF